MVRHARTFTLITFAGALAVAASDRDHHRAIRAVREGRPAEAGELLEKATGRVSTHFRSWTLLAELSARSGRVRDAHSFASRALLASPAHDPAARLLSFLREARPSARPPR